MQLNDKTMKQTLKEKTKHVCMGFPNVPDFRPSGLETTFTKAKWSHQVKNILYWTLSFFIVCLWIKIPSNTETTKQTTGKYKKASCRDCEIRLMVLYELANRNIVHH